jgi:hypothetical protein
MAAPAVSGAPHRVTILTDVPDELAWRGIERPRPARSFAISLDRAEPWGGGLIAGRVESRSDARDGRPITVSATCRACWLDIAPELVGKRSLLRPTAFWSLRMRGIPIWLDDQVWLDRLEVGNLAGANWRPFTLEVPPEAPRAFEGTFVAFRYAIEARRRGRLGSEIASLPILVVEQRTIPVVRVEANPIGEWRLLEHRSEGEVDSAGSRCSVRYEPR